MKPVGVSSRAASACCPSIVASSSGLFGGDSSGTAAVPVMSTAWSSAITLQEGAWQDEESEKSPSEVSVPRGLGGRALLAQVSFAICSAISSALPWWQPSRCRRSCSRVSSSPKWSAPPSIYGPGVVSR